MEQYVGAGTFVTLPITNSDELRALITAVLAATVDVELPASVVRSERRLRGALGVLRAALEKRHAAQGRVVPEADRRVLDRATDRAWRSFQQWLQSWASLEDGDPMAEKAAELHELLFHGGMGFLAKRMPLQWAEAEKRLDVLETAQGRQLVEALGGARFLARLERLHQEYGEAIGVTRPRAPAPEAVLIGPAYDAARHALRDYVGKVAATVEPDLPETGALAQRLLEPLVSWAPSSGGGGSPAQPVEPVAPVEPVEA